MGKKSAKLLIMYVRHLSSEWNNARSHWEWVRLSRFDELCLRLRPRAFFREKYPNPMAFLSAHKTNVMIIDNFHISYKFNHFNDWTSQLCAFEEIMKYRTCRFTVSTRFILVFYFWFYKISRLITRSALFFSCKLVNLLRSKQTTSTSSRKSLHTHFNI